MAYVRQRSTVLKLFINDYIFHCCQCCPIVASELNCVHYETDQNIFLFLVDY